MSYLVKIEFTDRPSPVTMGKLIGTSTSDKKYVDFTVQDDSPTAMSVALDADLKGMAVSAVADTVIPEELCGKLDTEGKFVGGMKPGGCAFLKDHKGKHTWEMK